ncbi:hypothetical protein PMAYCL1PPCAC_32094, partial [Pristionchus mayeri]
QQQLPSIKKVQNGFTSALAVQLIISMVVLISGILHQCIDLRDMTVWGMHLLVDATAILTVAQASSAVAKLTQRSFNTLGLCVAVHLLIVLFWCFHGEIARSKMSRNPSVSDPIWLLMLLHVVVSVGVVVYVFLKTHSWFRTQKQSRVTTISGNVAASKVSGAPIVVCPAAPHPPQYPTQPSAPVYSIDLDEKYVNEGENASENNHSPYPAQPTAVHPNVSGTPQPPPMYPSLDTPVPIQSDDPTKHY